MWYWVLVELLASGLARSMAGSCNTREAGERECAGMRIDLRMRAEGRGQSGHDKEQRTSWERAAPQPHSRHVPSRRREGHSRNQGQWVTSLRLCLCVCAAAAVVHCNGVAARTCARQHLWHRGQPVCLHALLRPWVVTISWSVRSTCTIGRRTRV